MKTRLNSHLKLGLASLLAGHALGALAQGFSLEGAVIDSRTGNSLGVVTERGDLNALFRAQKAMTFGILRSAGISLEQLSPEVRARVERFQTTNVEAFRAFSQGLDLKDQGKFAEAREAFKRAAELDPGFALATEQQRSMPDVNVSSSVQMRAVMQLASAAAVDRGKATFVVDLARALAALQAGLTVVTVPALDPSQLAINIDYTSNAPGSTANAQGSRVVALAYSLGNNTATPAGVISPNEWRADGVRATGGVLEEVRTTGGELVAARRAASLQNPPGSAPLSDGTLAYWGRWVLSATGDSPVVTVSGQQVVAPSLGAVDYIFAEAPRAMPNTGSATFTPAGGAMTQVQGNIAVNFVTASVALQNLGFQTGGFTFSGLNGSTTFNRLVGSGAFSGNYTSGSCVGCPGFTPTTSIYSGNFVGSGANGLVFSTLLNTGTGTVSGVHLFTRP